MINRHSVAQHTADELGIVPILRVEFLRQTLDGGLVATFVLKLEVVAACTVIVHLLDNLATGDGLRQYDTLIVILKTREDLIGIAVEQSDEGHPFLFVVLETHDVTLQFLRTHLSHLGQFAGGFHHGSLHVIVLCGVFLALLARFHFLFLVFL